MALSVIEEAYFQAWGKAGGPARVRRASRSQPASGR